MKRVAEPVRKNMLDVVKQNLKAAGRATYVTRIVYIGEYNGTPFNLEEKIESVIRNLEDDHTNVKITGFLLVYPQYYVHVLETSEDTIHKHFRQLYNHKTDVCELKKTIFLPSHHHVHARYFKEWFQMDAIPPTLIEKPQSYEVTDIKTQMSHCLTKIYTLCDTIANTTRDSSVAMRDVVKNIISKSTSLLPESTVLEYLLEATNPVLWTVENYLEVYNTIPLINLYPDIIWPPPRDFMFRGAFGKETRRSTIQTTVKEIRASHFKHHHKQQGHHQGQHHGYHHS